jgi:excisionase family DNA binding protein
MSALRIVEQDLRPFFTPKTLAAYLSVSERTVRQMLADHRIASVRVEGQRRIDHKDVEAYLARHRDEAA